MLERIIEMHNWVRSLVLTYTMLLLVLVSAPLFSQSLPPSQDISDVKPSELKSLNSHQLVTRGIDYMQNGEYNISRTYLEMAVYRAQIEDSVQNEILAINNIGNLFYYLNIPDSALNYYYKALDVAERSESINLQNTIHNNIGIIYGMTNNFVEARATMEKALAISVILKDTFKVTLNLINLSSQEIALGNFSIAKGYLNRAEANLKQLNETAGLYAIYVNLGNLNFFEKKYQEVLVFYKLGQQFLDRKYTFNDVQILNNIGRTYVQLGMQDSAMIYLTKAYTHADSANFLESASTALLWMTKSHEILGEFDQALTLMTKNLSLKDSIILIEKENWIEESMVKYKFESNQRELKLQSEISKRRTYLFRVLITSMIVIILLLLVILRMRKKASRLKDEKHKIEESNSKARLKKAASINKELKETIETINYELVSKTLLLDNKNQILTSIGKVVHDVEVNDTNNNQHVTQLKRHLLRDNNIDQNWEEFEIYFERVHTNFFKKIHESYPNLTTNDLRLMAFLLLQLNAHEIAQILNISPDSVRKRKQRLREKLHLPSGQNIENHLFTFTQ